MVSVCCPPLLSYLSLKSSFYCSPVDGVKSQLFFFPPPPPLPQLCDFPVLNLCDFGKTIKPCCLAVGLFCPLYNGDPWPLWGLFLKHHPRNQSLRETMILLQSLLVYNSKGNKKANFVSLSSIRALWFPFFVWNITSQPNSGEPQGKTPRSVRHLLIQAWFTLLPLNISSAGQRSHLLP